MSCVGEFELTFIFFLEVKKFMKLKILINQIRILSIMNIQYCLNIWKLLFYYWENVSDYSHR